MKSIILFFVLSVGLLVAALARGAHQGLALGGLFLLINVAMIVKMASGGRS